MKEQNNKKPVEMKNTSINGHNQVKKIFISDLIPDYRKISLKNDDSNNNFVNKNEKITVTRQMNFSPSSQSYKTESFNSYRYRHKPNIIIADNISERNERSEFKKLPISREKKIYLYLKNNSNKNVESNIILQNNTLLNKQEEISEYATLNASKKRQTTEGNISLNKPNIINQINNNSVNNIFVNIISATPTNDFSRNLVKNRFNSSSLNSNNNVDNNNGKATLSRVADSKASKIIVLKDPLSQTKLNNQNCPNTEKRKKLDYYSKIMFTANSFIFNNKNNQPTKVIHQQTDPGKIESNRNIEKKNEEPVSKEKFKKSKKFLKDYILKKKMKQMKNKKEENLNNHNNSFSCEKIDSKGLGKVKKNQKNPIFINIISKNPFMDEIREDKKVDLPIEKPKKRLEASNTTRFLFSDYNNPKDNNIIKNMENKTDNITVNNNDINKNGIKNKIIFNKKSPNNSPKKNSPNKNRNNYNNIMTYNNIKTKKDNEKNNNKNNIKIINFNTKFEKETNKDNILKNTNNNTKINNNTINNIIVINKINNNDLDNINNVNNNNKINNYISVGRSIDLKNHNKSNNKAEVRKNINYKHINNIKSKDNNNTKKNSKEKKNNNENTLFDTNQEKRNEKNSKDKNVFLISNNIDKKDDNEKNNDRNHNLIKSENMKHININNNFNTFNKGIINDNIINDSSIINLKKKDFRNINHSSKDNKTINEVKKRVFGVGNEDNNNNLFSQDFTDSKLINNKSQNNNNVINTNDNNIKNNFISNRNSLNFSTKINVTKNNSINNKKNTTNNNNLINNINNTNNNKNINDNNLINITKNLNKNNENINVYKNYKMYKSENITNNNTTTNTINSNNYNKTNNINNTNNNKIYKSISNNNTNSHSSKSNSIAKDYNFTKSITFSSNSTIKNTNNISNNNIIIQNNNIIKNNNIIHSKNFIINISKNNHNINNITDNSIQDTNYNTFYKNSQKIDNLTNTQEYKRKLNMTTPDRTFNKDNNSKSYNNSSNVSLISSPKRNVGITSIIIIKQSSKEKRMNYIKSEKSLFLGGQKKQCYICRKYIETHLLKIHLNSHPSQIFDWMYLGTFTNACDKDELRRIGIKYILNCAAECRNTNLPKDIKELHLNVRDEKWFDLIDYFEESNSFMNKVKMNGGIILVHCKFGISRSATFIIAYLIKYCGFTVMSALKFIKTIRNQINPNEGFLEQLLQYEKLIKSKEKQVKK